MLKALTLREGITHESDSLERSGASAAQEPPSVFSFNFPAGEWFLTFLHPSRIAVATCSSEDIIILSRDGDPRSADLETA